ncbi:serine-rich adhesin for platelets isoform X6 [Macrobrachium rosenbergii]|uniref:serine-rich adhesin for platelets isoform X6 n=1 Tax=Macrobrachium rosenbergii TaxID=79674 RepID=UPI0034D7B602
MGSSGHEEGTWRVFWAWVEGATGNMALALRGLVEQVLSWTPVGGLGGHLGLWTSMDTLHTLLVGWLVFVVLILAIGGFFYVKFVKKLEEEKLLKAAAAAANSAQPEEEDGEVFPTQGSSRSAASGRGGGGAGRSQAPAGKKVAVARKPTIVPDGPREPVAAPVATGADPDAVNWTNNIFTWFYNSVDGGPIMTKTWLETVSENTVKTALETGILVEVVEVYKSTPAPVLSNMVVDCSPSDNLTITCDCDTIAYIRLITTRTQGEETTESEYACAVSPLRGRLNIAVITEQLMAVVKFDGWPEVGIELEGIRNNATGLHEQSIVDVVTEVVTSAVRNSVLEMNFQNVSTFPRFRRARQAPDKIIPVGYDAMVRELQTHPPEVGKPKSVPVSLHRDEELVEAGESFTSLPFSHSLSQQGVLTTSEEQLIVRNLNKYPSLENTELDADDVSEWQKSWEQNYVPASEVPAEEPVPNEMTDVAAVLVEIKEPSPSPSPTKNFVLVASNRSKLIDEPRTELTIEEVIDDEVESVVRDAHDEPCLRRVNGSARDSILATPVIEPPKKLEDEDEEDLDHPLRLEEMEFTDKSLTGTSGVGPLPALPGLQKGPFVSEACRVEVKVSENNKLGASVQTASFEQSVPCDLSECDQEDTVPMQTLSQSPPHNQQSVHDDPSVCPFTDAANSPDDCHVNLLQSYASTSLELDTHCASAFHAIETDRSRETSHSSYSHSSSAENSNRNCSRKGDGLSGDFIFPRNTAMLDTDLRENETELVVGKSFANLHADLNHESTCQKGKTFNTHYHVTDSTQNLSLNCCLSDNIKFIDDSESEFEGECAKRAVAYGYSSEDNEEETLLKNDLNRELTASTCAFEGKGNEGTEKRICLNEFTDNLFKQLELEESELVLPEENVEILSWEVTEVYETNERNLLYSEDTKEDSDETLSESDGSTEDESETDSSDYDVKELPYKKIVDCNEDDVPGIGRCNTYTLLREESSTLTDLNKSSSSVETNELSSDEEVHYVLDRENSQENNLDPTGLVFRNPSFDLPNNTNVSNPVHELVITNMSAQECEYPIREVIRDSDYAGYLKSDTSECDDVEDEYSDECPDDGMAKLSELSDTLAETDDENDTTLFEDYTSVLNNTNIKVQASEEHFFTKETSDINMLSNTSIITQSSKDSFDNISSDSTEVIDFNKIDDLIRAVKEADCDSAVVDDSFSISGSQDFPREYSLDSSYEIRSPPSASEQALDEKFGFQSTKSKFLMGMISSENVAVDPSTYFGHHNLNLTTFGMSAERQRPADNESDALSRSSSILSDAVVGNSTDSEEELKGSFQEDQDIFSDEQNGSLDHNWRTTDIEKIAEAEIQLPSHSDASGPSSIETHFFSNAGAHSPPAPVVQTPPTKEESVPSKTEATLPAPGFTDLSMLYFQTLHVNKAAHSDNGFDGNEHSRSQTRVTDESQEVKENTILSSAVSRVAEIDSEVGAMGLNEIKSHLSLEEKPCPPVSYDVSDKQSHKSDGRNETNNVLEFSGDSLLTTKFVNVDALTQLDTARALTHQQVSSSPGSSYEYITRDESTSDASLTSGLPRWSRPQSSYPVHGTSMVVSNVSSSTQGQPMGIPGLNGKRLLVKIVKAVGIGCDKSVSEAYAVVEMDEPAQKFTTAVVKDTSSPFWDEQFLFDLSEGTLELLFELYDKIDGNFLGLGIVGIEELVATPSQRQIIPLQSRPYEDDEVSGSLTVEFLFLDRADLPDLTLRSSATSQSLSAKGDLVTTTTTTYVKAPECKDVIVNGGDGVAAAVLRDIEEKKVVVANNANKSTMIIHASRKEMTKRVIQVQRAPSGEYKELMVQPGEEDGYNEIPVEDLTALTTTATTTTTTVTTSITQSTAVTNSVIAPSTTTTTASTTTTTNTESLDPSDLDERGRSRGNRRKRDSFFGTLKKRFSRSKVRSKSMDPGARDVSLDRDPSVGRSVSMERAANVRASGLLSVPASTGGDGGSTRSSISDTSAISSSSTRTYVNEASTLIVETSENGILKHFLIPLALQQKSKWRKKGLKLHVFGEHTFIAKHMPSSTPCQVCQKTLGRRFGKQGYECRDCGFKCHKPCHVKTDTVCPNSTVNNMDLEYVKDPREERRNRLKKLKST